MITLVRLVSKDSKMQQLEKIFNFQENLLSTCLDSGDKSTLWYRLTHVCKILGFKNPTVAKENHCKKRTREIHTGSGRAAVYIQRGDLIRLTFASKKEYAENFQDWAIDLIEEYWDKGVVINLDDITIPQAIAARETLNCILDKAAPWERLYDENRNKGFKWFGYRFYNDYIYSFFTTEEWCKINNLNPVRKEKNGRCDRLQRIHQYIEPATKDRLRDTVAVVLGFVDASNTPEEFQELYRRKYGRIEQLKLPLK